MCICNISNIYNSKLNIRNSWNFIHHHIFDDITRWKLCFIKIRPKNESWIYNSKLKFFILRQIFNKIPSGTFSKCLTLLISRSNLNISPIFFREFSLSNFPGLIYSCDRRSNYNSFNFIQSCCFHYRQSAFNCRLDKNKFIFWLLNRERWGSMYNVLASFHCFNHWIFIA